MHTFEKLFDVFALLIRKILDNTDEKFFEQFSALDQSKADKILEELETLLPELFHNKNVVPINISLCTDAFFKRLEMFCSGEVNKHQNLVIVILLSKLDIILKKCVENYTTSSGIKGINSNVKQTRIHLLPRVECSWEHKSRGTCHSNDLMNYLRFFYFIDMDEIQDYEIINYFLPSNLFENAIKTNRLKIGMSPLSNQGTLELAKETREGTRYFSVEELKGCEEIDQNLAELENEAARQQIDILIMPEMLAGPQTLEILKDKLSEFPEDGMEYPALTFAPSQWKKHHNKVTVLNQLGEVIAEQEKQHPYLYEDDSGKYLEDIMPEKKICLIHCEGIGRIAILICKDALITKYMKMVLDVLKATLLIIPSFSTGSYDFQEIISCCKAADCCACWINTCSVGNLEGVDTDKLEQIGEFLRCGKKSALKNGTYLCERKSKSCDGKGTRDCRHCIFVCELPFG